MYVQFVLKRLDEGFLLVYRTYPIYMKTMHMVLSLPHIDEDLVGGILTRDVIIEEAY